VGPRAGLLVQYVNFACETVPCCTACLANPDLSAVGLTVSDDDLIPVWYQYQESNFCCNILFSNRSNASERRQAMMSS
jgi:hypothetical protein